MAPEPAELSVEAADKARTELVFWFPRNTPARYKVLVIAVIGCIGVLALTVALTWKQIGSDRPGVMVIVAILVVSLTWVGIRGVRVRVELSGERITVRNFLRTRTSRVDGIREISLKIRTGGENTRHWVPFVELTDGGGIWIEALDCGLAHLPPHADRVAALDELRALIRRPPSDSSNDQGGAGSRP